VLTLIVAVAVRIARLEVKGIEPFIATAIGDLFLLLYLVMILAS
jgi:hypothetical protein